MDLVAIFLLLFVLVLIVFFLSRPFFERKRVHTPESSREYSALLAERERLLTTLQELEFDQTLGKIPEEDYPSQRKELVRQGAEILRKLDAISPGSAKRTNAKGKPATIETSGNADLSDEDLEDLLAKRRTSRKDKTAGFCPNCGKPVMRSDIFCPSCGNPIK